jgi:Zn-dependent peptidase ImmA (M78 family)
MPDSRQIFTLFHELAHLLLRSGGIDFRSRTITKSFSGQYHNIEVICNRFANEFLVPQEVFDTFEPKITESNISNLADYFSVSREVILRNYFERGLVDQLQYETLADKWKKEGGGSKEEPSPETITIIKKVTSVNIILIWFTVNIIKTKLQLTTLPST